MWLAEMVYTQKWATLSPLFAVKLGPNAKDAKSWY